MRGRGWGLGDVVDFVGELPEALDDGGEGAGGEVVGVEGVGAGVDEGFDYEEGFGGGAVDEEGVLGGHRSVRQLPKMSFGWYLDTKCLCFAGF